MRSLPAPSRSSRRPATAALLLMAALLAAALPGCARRGRDSIDSLAWLSGCWEGKGEDGAVDAQWGQPAGGSLVGTSRTVKGDRTVSTEFLQVREAAEGLVLTVHPLGQPPASYRLERAGRTSAVFANPAQDFPRRIVYQRKGGNLTVRAEGDEADHRRAIRLKLKKTACP
ncbi:MAG: DUF6265 family protein [Candidatus Krumholzibacteriia bacterium]